MTLEHETIERQFEELRQQYTFLENVCKELTRQVEFKDAELDRMEILLSDMRMKLVAAECRACKCHPETYRGC